MIGIALIIIGLAEVIVGLWFIFRYQWRQSSSLYGFFSLGVAIFVLSNGVGFLDNNNSLTAIAERGAWVGATIATTFFLGFSYSFILQRKTIQELTPLLVWPFLVFVPGIIFSDVVIGVGESVTFGRGYSIDTGQLFWAYTVFFCWYWFWSVFNLYELRKNADGDHRKHLNILIGGIVASLSLVIGFDIVLPLFFSTPAGYVGSLATSIWLGATTWILVR